MSAVLSSVREAGNSETRTVLSSVRGYGQRVRGGFTLIEIVVVVAIIAVLAMLLVPRLAFIRTMATYANQAASIQDVAQNMLIYHSTQGMWPDHFDSLLENSTPSGLYGSGSGVTNGLDSNLSGVLTMTTLTTNQKKSLVGLLGQANAGATTLTLMDHDPSVSQPGDSGTFARDLNASGANLSVATVNYTGASVPSDPNAASATVIFNSVYANGNPNNETLVAIGVGPSCTAVGKTILTPPQAYTKDASRYNRTVVLIRVRPDGVQASLAGGLSPDGRTLSQCLGNYRVTAQR